MPNSTTTVPSLSAVITAPSMAPVYVRLVLVALFWGGTFIAGRMIAGAMSGMLAATIRYAIAVPLLLLVAWRFEGGLPRLNLRQLLLTFGLGLTGIFLYNVCFFAALAQMPAGRTALFVAFNPIVTALLLSLLLRERVGPIKWLGIGLAFIGAAVIVTRGDIGGALRDISGSLGAGEGFMLLGVTGWAAYTLIGRTAMKSLSPIAATTYASLWGLALLACGAWAQAIATDRAAVSWSAISRAAFSRAAFGWADLAALAYLGVFGTVISFVWYYQGVKAIGAAQTAVFNNLVPVFGILLAAVLLSEPILTSMIVGGVLVITGVTLTNRTPKATGSSFGRGEAAVASGDRQ